MAYAIQAKTVQNGSHEKADAALLVNAAILKTKTLYELNVLVRTRPIEERYQKLLEYAVKNRVTATFRQVFDMAHHAINSMFD
jgi:hypothetical protein